VALEPAAKDEVHPHQQGPGPGGHRASPAGRRVRASGSLPEGRQLLDLGALGALGWMEDRLRSTRRSGVPSCSLMGVRWRDAG
jgi:hypothetical protein